MPSMIDFSGTKYIYISMGGMAVSNSNSHGNLDNALVKIPVNCNKCRTPYHGTVGFSIELYYFHTSQRETNCTVIRSSTWNSKIKGL